MNVLFSQLERTEQNQQFGNPSRKKGFRADGNSETCAMARKRLSLFLGLATGLLASLPAQAQEDVTGTGFGIPHSTPGAFWPRAMSATQLGPGKLYPDGPNFGLGNTSGGFGLTGSGPLSGVGLTERSINPLTAREMSTPSLNRRLGEMFQQESILSGSIFSSVLAGQARREMQSPFTPTGSQVQMLMSGPLPSIDSVLRDKPSSIDSILNR